MHETVFKDRLANDRRPVGQAHQRHELGLQIGRETRIGRGLHVDGPDRAIAHDTHGGLTLLNRHAGLPQIRPQRLIMRRNHAGQGDIAARRSRRHGIGAGLDTVGHHRPYRGLERRDALNRDRAGARAGDLRAHGIQAIGQVLNLRLARAILQLRCALRQHRCQHGVLGRAHRDKRKDDMAALEPARRCLGQHIAFFQRDPGAQCLHGFQVQVDRARADGAATRQGDFRLALARQKRAKHVEGGAHLAHQIIGRCRARKVRSREAQPVAGLLFSLHAQMGQKVRHEARIRQARHVFQEQLAFGQQACRHQLQSRVLRAGNLNGAGKWLFPANDDAIHENGPENG